MILCSSCHKPKANYDFVVEAAGEPGKVIELCEECLGKQLVALIEDNFRFLVTAWSRKEDGHTKVVVEGVYV